MSADHVIFKAEEWRCVATNGFEMSRQQFAVGAASLAVASALTGSNVMLALVALTQQPQSAFAWGRQSLTH